MIPEEILSDNVSGSAEIADKAVNWLIDGLMRVSKGQLNERIRSLGSLSRVFPHFAVLAHMTQAIESHFRDKSSETDTRALLDSFRQFMADYKVTWIKNQHLAATRLLSKVNFSGKKVFLHSHSSSLIILFELLAKQDIRPLVCQTVSEPGREGIIQAKRLAQLGFRVQLINEAAAGRFMPEAGLLITGADAIYPDYLVNKTGTLPLALLSRHFGKPYYVLADSRKIVSEKISEEKIYQGFAEKKKPAAEIIENPPEGIEAVNYYFEPLARNLVHEIYTE